MEERIKVLNSFDKRTIKIEAAGKDTHGIRFYDNKKSFEKGHYLFDTFTPSINRNNLALPPSWNKMTHMKQFKIREGTMMIKGNAASQSVNGVKYSGGAEQMFIHNTEDLLDVN